MTAAIKPRITGAHADHNPAHQMFQREQSRSIKWLRFDPRPWDQLDMERFEPSWKSWAGGLLFFGVFIGILLVCC